MLITIESSEWTSLNLDSDTTYAIQCQEPFNGCWSISTSGSPESRKDGITVFGSTTLKLKATGNEKVLVVSKADLPMTLVAVECA